SMRPDRLFGGSFFYGWVVVVAAFVLMGVGFGVAYSFPRYFEPLSREFNADRATISLVFSITGLIYFGLGAVSGPLTDRFGPRLLSALAACLYLIGLVLASQAVEIWQIYLTYSIFVGLGVAATYVPSVSTVQRWFVRRRGLASGLAVSGIGVGTFLGPIATNALIESYDWRVAYLATGVVAAALTLVAGWLLLRSPALLGVGADGAPLGSAAAPVGGRLNPTDRTVGEALRTREFLGLYLVIAFTCFPVFFGFVHLGPFAMDAGLDPATATQVAVGGIGVGSALGRLLLSPFADRFGRKLTYAFTVAGVAALMAVWLVLPADQVVLLAVFAFLFGTAYGGFVALCPAMMADYFGTSYVSGTIGVFYTGAGIGAFLGPLLGGRIFDQFGSYQYAIILGVVLAAIATIVVLVLRGPAEAKAQWAPERPAVSAPVGGPVAAGPGTMGSQAAPPAPGTTELADWTTWLGDRYAEEMASVADLDAWVRREEDAELAEVLEIVAARSRDRAFQLRRAGAAGSPPPPGVATDHAGTADDLARLAALVERLDAYAGPAPTPPSAGPAGLVARLRASVLETRDLLNEQRERRMALRRRQAIRLVEGPAAQVVAGGDALWKPLSANAALGADVVRVVQWPGSVVRLPPSGDRCVVLLEGSGQIRSPGGVGALSLDGVCVQIGRHAEVEVVASGDLPLSYLLIGGSPLPLTAETAKTPAALVTEPG
ncbi:MAG TPA: MFS transporter, partial [Dehalococcoidia bacterium]|nr:MFS transporter [Dehalococcoidia bacterium]